MENNNTCEDKGTHANSGMTENCSGTEVEAVAMACSVSVYIYGPTDYANGCSWYPE